MQSFLKSVATIFLVGTLSFLANETFAQEFESEPLHQSVTREALLAEDGACSPTAGLFRVAARKCSFKAKQISAGACRCLADCASCSKCLNANQCACETDHWDHQAAIETEISETDQQTQRIRELRSKLRERSRHNRLLTGAVAPAKTILCGGAGASVGVASQTVGCAGNCEGCCESLLNGGACEPTSFAACEHVFKESFATPSYNVRQVCSEQDSEQEFKLADELLAACSEAESVEDLAGTIAEIAEQCEQQPGGKQIARVLTTLAIERYQTDMKLEMIEHEVEIREELQEARLQQAVLEAKLESQEALLEIAEEAMEALFAFGEMHQGVAGQAPQGMMSQPYSGWTPNPYPMSPALHHTLPPVLPPVVPTTNPTNLQRFGIPYHAPSSPYPPAIPASGVRPRYSAPFTNGTAPATRQLRNSLPETPALPPSVHVPEDQPAIPNTNDNQASDVRFRMPVYQDAHSARVARSVEAVKQRRAANEDSRTARVQPENRNR